MSREAETRMVEEVEELKTDSEHALSQPGSLVFFMMAKSVLILWSAELIAFSLKLALMNISANLTPSA